jgi:putative DNA primase/helicase
MANRPTSFRAARQQRTGKNLDALMEHMEHPSHPGWADALAFNELTHAVEVRPPWPPVAGIAKGEPEPLDELRHVLPIQRYFQQQGHDATKTTVWDALMLHAIANAHHPVRAYLDGLIWDGTPRLYLLCERYFGALMPADPAQVQGYRDYLACAGRYTMVGAAARVYRPGCKMDTILVLVGEKQGERKSQAIEALSPTRAWWSENVAKDLLGKESKEDLCGKWLIELAELHHLRDSPEALKSFLSTSVDRFRPPYARASADHPRQCALFGTANDLVLTDPTGNRRFWPFKVGALDLKAIENDRDQLWAEAVHAFKGGGDWWPTQAESGLFENQQQQFEYFDTWQTQIYQWASVQQKFTMSELFDALKANLTNGWIPKPGDENRAGSCLRRLGYFKVQKRIDGDQAYVWAKRRTP